MVQYAPPNPARAKLPKPVVLPHGTTHKTPAGQQLIRLATGLLGRKTGKKKMSTRVRGKTRRTRKVSKTSGGTRRRKRSATAALVKGSAAAKKRMAKLRGMRKKK